MSGRSGCQSYTVVDACQCAPLTRVARGSIDLAPRSNTFCTTDIYRKCWKKATGEMSRKQAEAKKEQTCLPCSGPKNMYTITNELQVGKRFVFPPNRLRNMNFTEIERRNSSLWPSARLLLNIVCLDQSYVLLLEKPQLSLSQFISQDR